MIIYFSRSREQLIQTVIREMEPLTLGKNNLKTGMSKLEVTDNICPFESPRIWHQEIWFFKSRSIRETKKFSQKNKQWEQSFY